MVSHPNSARSKASDGGRGPGYGCLLESANAACLSASGRANCLATDFKSLVKLSFAQWNGRTRWFPGNVASLLLRGSAFALSADSGNSRHGHSRDDTSYWQGCMARVLCGY